jgi:hypothetical protein
MVLAKWTPPYLAGLVTSSLSKLLVNISDSILPIGFMGRCRRQKAKTQSKTYQEDPRCRCNLAGGF